ALIMVKQRLAGGELDCFIDKMGDVVVEGASIGAMTGLRFEPDPTVLGEQGRVLISAARRVIDEDIQRRVREITAAPDDVFSIGASRGGASSGGASRSGAGGGTGVALCWNGMPVAALGAGDNALSPQISVSRNEFLDGPRREMVRARLSLWVSHHIERRLGPLFRAKSAEVSGSLRGVVYQLAESLGSAPREDIKVSLDKLSTSDRKALAKLGVRIGLHSVYFHDLLNASAIRTRAILASIYCDACDVPRRPKPSRAADGASATVWAMMGFQVVGGRALRVDVLEKFAALTRKLARSGPFTPPQQMLSMAGCDAAALVPVLRDLGYRPKETADGTVFLPKKRRGKRRHDPRKNQSRASEMDPHSPFAKLRELALIK
ncbi:MAG: hypothetical protein JKY20_11660, partial [Alphaproteobacteria bacterium]|nr:hypothetical protein [Alphaproteobacteria bacterium]